MKTGKILGILFISGALAYQMGCKRELNDIQTEQVSAVELSTTPVGRIYQTIHGNSKGSHTFTLTDEKLGEWKITAYVDDFLAPDFAAVDGEGNAIPGASAKDFITLTGQLDDDPNSSVKITLNGKWMEGIIWTDADAYHIQSRFSIASLEDGNYAMEKVTSSSAAGYLPCGTQTSTVNNVNEDSDPNEVGLDELESITTTCKKLQLRANADYEYYAGTANYDANLATFGIVFSMHSASNFFDVVNLDFELGQVVVFTSRSNLFYYPTSITMAGMLSQMANFHNYFFGNPTSQFDAVILFTGKRTVEAGGMAYYRTVCKYNGMLSYAIVGTRFGNGTNYPANAVIKITAHEVGHLLRAEHTRDIPISSPCRSYPLSTTWDIMNDPGNSTLNFSFHECAIRQINRHLAEDGGCLSQGTCN